MKNESTSERYMRNRSFMSSDASEKSMTRWPAYSFSANARASVLFPVRRAPSSRSARLPREPSFQDRSFSYALRHEHAATSPFRLRPHETGTLYRLDSTRNGRCGSHFPYTKREVRKRLSIHETGGSARSAQAPGPARPSPRKWGAAYRAAPAGGPVPARPPPPELAIICSSRKEKDV